LTDYSLDLLNTFITFVESNNIVEAAKKLHISQPAVSLHLKKLESHMPYPLFSFEGKKKVLSRYGKSIYSEIKTKVSDVSKAIETVNQAYGDPALAVLKLGARHEVLQRLAPLINFPGQVQLINVPTEVAITMLLKHELDIALSHERPDLTNIIARKLFSDTAKFVINRKRLKGTKLTLSTIKSQKLLQETPVLAYKADTPAFLTEWMRYLGYPLSSLNLKCVCADWWAIIKMVEADVGYSIIPTSIAVNRHAVAEFDIPTKVISPTIFYALYHKDLKSVSWLKSFLSFV